MRRVTLYILLVLGAALVGTAAAQRLECQPKNTCKRPVEFLPTSADYVGVLDCDGCTYLYPDPRSPEIEFRIKRDRDEAYTVEVSRSAWNPDAEVSLEARYSLEGGASPLVLDWRPVTESPLRLLDADAKRTQIRVEYRLKVSGAEPVGSFEVSVTYFAEDAKNKKNKKDAVSHDVLFVLEPALVLRLDSAVPTGATNIDFDIGAARIADYFEAVEKEQLLRPSTLNLQAVEIFSNYPNGYNVTAHVVTVSGPVSSSLTAENLWAGEASLDGQSFIAETPTNGFATLLAGIDYGLHVDGREAAGVYRFSVTFDAVPTP